MTSPSEYFRICVAESNHLSHFGSDELRDWLSLPPAEYNPNTQKLDSIGYVNVVKKKIEQNEAQLSEINALKENHDNKEIMDASKNLYKYAIAIQQKEYVRIAAAKDHHASDIDSLLVEFDGKYKKEFEDKLNLLWGYGTQYANRHGINLNRQPNQQ